MLLYLGIIKVFLEDAQDLSNTTTFLDEGARKFYKSSSK